MMCPGRGLWEMESGMSGKGYRMGCPLVELVGTPARDRDSYAEFTLHDFQSHRITVVFTLHDYLV